MKTMRIAIGFLIVSALTVVAATAGDVSQGQPAPNVAAHDARGATVHLADFKGKVVLVDFWASWCGPCNASFPALDALYREYRQRGVEVVAINVDEQQRNADAFLQKRPHEMTVLFDPKGTSPEAFGVRGMPTSFLIDRDGRVQYTHMGYTLKTIESYRHELDALLSQR